MKKQIIVPVILIFFLFISDVLSQAGTQKKIGGIGALLSRDISSYIRIDDVAPGGPGEIAGLQKNDLLFEIEGTNLSRIFIPGVVQMLKGEIGTSVKVKVFRLGEVVQLSIRRDKVALWLESKCLEGDCKNGYAKTRSANGTITEGFMKEGRYYGDITQIKLNGEKHLIKLSDDGKSTSRERTIIYPDNRKYVGSVTEGVPNAKGTMTYPDGSKRSGSWIFGQFVEGCYEGDCENGYGVLYYLDGMRYSGEIKNKKANGYGTMTINYSVLEIDKIIGNFEEDIPQSPAQIFFKNGDKYEGNFAVEIHAGETFTITRRTKWGKQQYENGDIYEGNWKDNNMHGFGTLIKSNGDRYVGKFYQGKLYDWVFVCKNGKLQMHVYKDGQILQDQQAACDEWLAENLPSKYSSQMLQQYVLAARDAKDFCLFGDCENGIGVSYFGPGLEKPTNMEYGLYFGSHVNGKAEGPGELYKKYDPLSGDRKVTYIGTFKNGMRHGKFDVWEKGRLYQERLYYEDRYISNEFGSLEGYEKFLAKLEREGEIIIAETKSRMDAWKARNSTTSSGGTRHWRQSSTDVVVSGDGKNGHNCIQYGNGDYYQGELKDGMYHGEGRLSILSSGQRIVGTFKNGVLDGNVRFYDRFGNHLEAVCENGNIVSGTAYNADGCKVTEGIYRGGSLVQVIYRSQTCDFSSGATEEEALKYNYSSESSGSGYTQETIYYNKGTKDQWSVRIPVRKR